MLSSAASPESSRTIGVLVDSLYYYYSTDILNGILHSARAHDVRVLCFVGGWIETPAALGNRGNFLYDLVSRQNVEGLLMVTGSFGNYCSQEVLARFVRRYAPIPTVSIGAQIEGVPSVLVDNDFGMSELVHHVIRYHGRRHIAYINGTATSHDAIARFNTYKKVLGEYGLPFDPNMVLSGNFTPESGREAMQVFLDEHPRAFDALVAGNDEMATGAMKVLQERGVIVPDEVVVTGFDDALSARTVLPPLTTVRQPTFEMGAGAYRILTKMLDGSEVPEIEQFPARLVVRGSCGCYVRPKVQVEHTLPRHSEGVTKREQMVNESATQLRTLYDGSITNVLDDENWAIELVDALFDEIDGHDGVFLARVQKDIARSIGRSVKISTWSEVIFDLFHLLPDSVRHRDRFASITNDTFTFLTHQVENNTILRQQRYEQQTLALYRANHDLLGTMSSDQFSKMLQRMLTALSLKDCHISLFDAQNKLSCYSMLTYRDGNIVPLPVDGSAAKFSASDLVPGGVSMLPLRTTLFVMPLFFEDENLGFAVCDHNSDVSFPIYETMAGQLSTALKTLRMVERLVTHADNLEKEVARRTSDLQRKGVEIQQLHDALVKESRLDSLTGLYNRKAFFEFLHMELNRTRRHNERLRAQQDGVLDEKDAATFSLLMLDLDHFKAVNDTHGHLAGDKVLQAVGGLFQAKAIFRAEDVSGRFGGEEFIVLLVGAHARDALPPAERLMRELGKMSFSDKRASYKVTLSIGVAEYRMSDKDELEIINRADQALYTAKQNGRNQIQFFGGKAVVALGG
jgi:sigma-B regulation protein RsbU (phosphoserine phosphatase)